MEERCSRCTESVAPGSARWSDRVRDEDGALWCADCAPNAFEERPRLTDRIGRQYLQEGRIG
jgi:hypothetical protein